MTVKVAYCLSFNFEECTKKEDVAEIYSSVENGDDSWLQIDENGDEASQVFEVIEIPSYVALISDDSSEPVYFVKVEVQRKCEEIMTKLIVWRKILIQGKNIFGESIYEMYDQGIQIKGSYN